MKTDFTTKMHFIPKLSPNVTIELLHPKPGLDTGVLLELDEPYLAWQQDIPTHEEILHSFFPDVKQLLRDTITLIKQIDKEGINEDTMPLLQQYCKQYGSPVGDPASGKISVKDFRLAIYHASCFLVQRNNQDSYPAIVDNLLAIPTQYNECYFLATKKGWIVLPQPIQPKHYPVYQIRLSELDRLRLNKSTGEEKINWLQAKYFENVNETLRHAHQDVNLTLNKGTPFATLTISNILAFMVIIFYSQKGSIGFCENCNELLLNGNRFCNIKCAKRHNEKQPSNLLTQLLNMWYKRGHADYSTISTWQKVGQDMLDKGTPYETVKVKLQELKNQYRKDSE